MLKRITNFLQETRAELQKVIWPTKFETIRLTRIVIIVSLVVSIYLFLADYIFSELIRFII